MASAQVLPNSAPSSRKQGHLEAGKKRLEEFRKKKGRAKKDAAAGHLRAAEVDHQEKSLQNYDHVRDSTTSARNNSVANDTYDLDIGHEGKMANSTLNVDIGSSNDTHAISPVLADSDHAYYGNKVQDVRRDEASRLHESLVYSRPSIDYYGHWRDSNELSHIKDSKFEPKNGFSVDGFNASDTGYRNHIFEGEMNSSRVQFDSQSGKSSNLSKNNLSVNSYNAYGTYNTNIAPERTEGVSSENRLGFPSTSASIPRANGEMVAGAKEYDPGSINHGHSLAGRKVIDSSSHQNSSENAAWNALEHLSMGPSSPTNNSNEKPFPSNDSFITGRSRPSFLDSLGLSRVSPSSHKPYYNPQKANPPVPFINFKSQSREIHASSSVDQLASEPNASEYSHELRTPDTINGEVIINSSIASNDGQLSKPAASGHLHREQELPTKNDDDFSALEQYIEDLTQEKFSLQRALDTSRNLSESLASENSSLTESYNQQGQLVNQLKFDMERFKEEIKAQQLALESFKLDYTNAQLECNAADERAKLLASEVIALEEKVLRLRSNELKLEKQLENMNSEITSYKRKVSSLEKGCQDFQSTIDALQEEKKLLQSKLRKASTDRKINTNLRTLSNKSDAFTSTDDLGIECSTLVDGGTSIAERTIQNSSQDISLPESLSTSNLSFFLPEDGSSLSDTYSSIPNDHLRIINNINSLISELALEKQELMQALTNELSDSSKLKDLNLDLSRKLESQTQRLELLTAQRMTNDNVLFKPVDIRSMHDTTEYADEGDEVVERVLGWIMKLFPGGSTKRRTSKLL